MPLRLLALACIAGFVCAQSPEQPRRNTYRTQGGASATRERLVSPEVHTDRRITFRIRAPKASEVTLAFGAWNPKPQPMSKDAVGIWTITVGPMQPEIYTYAFSLDGLRVLDQANPNLKIGVNGLDASVVEVSGSPQRFDEVQNVPHGAIHIRTYMSTAQKRLRGLYVYVPPDYETGRRYPAV